MKSAEQILTELKTELERPNDLESGSGRRDSAGPILSLVKQTSLGIPVKTPTNLAKPSLLSTFGKPDFDAIKNKNMFPSCHNDVAKFLNDAKNDDRASNPTSDCIRPLCDNQEVSPAPVSRFLPRTLGMYKPRISA